MRLNSLPGKAYRFDAIDKGDPNIRDRLLQNMMAPKTITLKEGAQVMLIKNMDETLVNGSLGKVVRFMDEASFDVYEPEAELGPSSTPHSSLPVSKVRLKDFALDGDMRDPTAGDKTAYPVVRFMANNGTSRDILCNPEEWRVDSPTGEMQASRTQLPLILAWALSIHKAQGQTLDRVKVDLGKAFEKGQTYVALSRATSQEGLQVLRFDRSKVMAHPRVVHFYNNLYTADDVTLKGSMKMASNFFKGASTAGDAEPGTKGKGMMATWAHT